MILFIIILPIVIGIIVGIIEDERAVGFGAWFASLLFGTFIALCVSLCIPNSYLDGKIDYTYDLKAFTTNTETKVSGNCFLLFGQYNESEELVYRAMVGSERGYQMKEYNMDDVYIVETNESEPRIERYIVSEKDWIKWLAIPCGESYYKIYIPEDSIMNEFNVDLE